ncbi:MAG: phage tail protein, partial [Oxalobacter formigenes]|nr:phage tail protein [Oxalobacter formigenes]
MEDDLHTKLANALKNISSLPVAFMTMWPSATLPADGKWMERNGDILTIADYPDLFAILGN